MYLHTLKSSREEVDLFKNLSVYMKRELDEMQRDGGEERKTKGIKYQKVGKDVNITEHHTE